ncbi:MAG: aminopeptidase [Clostridia bacterium]|nr:aminopeptidase [Clostridia bacterium]MBQ5662517.1 aminopeptidase [Clostridia bacterium]MBQ5772322.1 aminopeptidase [Clostridia bacterium]
MSDARKNLVYEKKTVYEKAGEKIVAEAYEYAKGYVKFLDAAKTEREAVCEGVKLAETAGYRPYTFGDTIKAGDKLYYNNRGKNIFLFSIGTEDINNGIRITAAHIDSPRLDLKQVPLYEDNGMCFLKTHYYGGIRKYQWLAMPLALHGVVVKQDGEVLDVVIGERDEDPVMYITDLLPHLAGAYNEKPLGKAVTGEQLNILVGSRPLADEDKDAVKLGVLQYLYDTYGITEEDFLSAELSIVPAGKARDVGFDRSMISGYGHDDRVCAYPSITAMIDAEEKLHTTMCLLVDKEETGSDGVTGMQSSLITDLITEIAKALGGNEATVRANSKCLSSDVTAIYDPNFPDVYEHRNSALLGCGVGMCKFTGSRGKGGTSDASAELVAWVRRCLNEAGVVWQTCELGKIDVGGGGTVAKFMANHNIDTVDLGVGVLSMHAPYELISKVDLYESYRAFKAFYAF